MTMKQYIDDTKLTMQDYCQTVSFNLTPHTSNGESVELVVDYFKNEDRVYHNIHFANHCYGTHFSKISYYGVNLDQLLDAVNKAVDQNELI